MSTRVATANIRVTLDHLQAAQALNDVLSMNPDLGGLQEFGSSRDSLLKAASGYDYARNSIGGGPVFWRRDRYGLLRCRAVRLSRAEFVGNLAARKSRLPASWATVAILSDDDTGAEPAVVNFHLTAEVQYGGGYRTDRAHRLRVWRHKREVRRLMRLARRLRRRGRPVYLLGDTNFDGLKLRGLTSCWEGRDGKTLGGRAVDVIFADRKPRAVRTVKTASDHRGVIADY